MNRTKVISITLTSAQIKELGRLEKETGLSRSSLIQQAVNVLIFQLGKNNDKKGNSKVSPMG